VKLPHLTRDWEGETVFLVCGGPSVTQHDVDRLRGHRVVAINSSWEKCPWADALLFADIRWWRTHRREVLSRFEGEIVTITPHHKLHDRRTLVLERQGSGGLSHDPTRLACWHTSVTTAVNMIALRGATHIYALGLDGKGGWHHAPHPAAWGVNKSKFKYHAEALEALVEPLVALGVGVTNLNPDSEHRMFPFSTLDVVLGPDSQLSLQLEAAQ
jgi:hypothetical protein